jgi:hypothetical protein
MKKFNSLSIYLVLACIISLAVFSCNEKATTTEAAAEKVTAPPYEPSPNEEANIKLVSDFIAALVATDDEKAKSMVSNEFMDNGPGKKDSATIDQMTARWATNLKERSNQDPGIYAANSLQVNEGDFAGQWVHVWGNYTADVNGSDYKYDVPWHRVFIITDGKISFSQVWYDSLSTALDLGAVVPVETLQ